MSCFSWSLKKDTNVIVIHLASLSGYQPSVSVIGAYYILWKVSSENKHDNTLRPMEWDRHQHLAWNQSWSQMEGVGKLIRRYLEFISPWEGRKAVWGWNLISLMWHSMSSTPPSEEFAWWDELLIDYQLRSILQWSK